MTSHAHTHTHPHADVVDDTAQSPEAAQLGPTGPGSVVLDIGGSWGSLMITTPQDLAGAEIEVSRIGDDLARTHIAIRERQVPAGTRWVGIFPRLLAGDYTVYNLDGSPRTVVTVIGGHVTDLIWS